MYTWEICLNFLFVHTIRIQRITTIFCTPSHLPTNSFTPQQYANHLTFQPTGSHHNSMQTISPSNQQVHATIVCKPSHLPANSFTPQQYANHFTFQPTGSRHNSKQTISPFNQQVQTQASYVPIYVSEYWTFACFTVSVHVSIHLHNLSYGYTPISLYLLCHLDLFYLFTSMSGQRATIPLSILNFALYAFIKNHQ